MASSALTSNLVEVIAAEMASGVDRAVECWMSQIEEALTDVHLTSLGRLQAVRQVIAKYKELTGKAQLRGRAASSL
jgi:hypothetical protein